LPIAEVAPEEVIRLANASAPRFPELAGPVVNAAEHGDASARLITDRAGKALASLASAVIKRLWRWRHCSGWLAGGVLQDRPGAPSFKEAMSGAAASGGQLCVCASGAGRPGDCAQRGVRR